MPSANTLLNPALSEAGQERAFYASSQVAEWLGYNRAPGYRSQHFFKKIQAAEATAPRSEGPSDYVKTLM